MDRRTTLALLATALLPALSRATTGVEPASSDLVDDADALLRPGFAPDQAGGVLLLRREAQVLFRTAYGRADVAQGTPLAADALMRIGSITKPFTALAVLQLVRDGALKLDDRLDRHLPDFKDGGAPVTLQQLLAHTAGLGNYTELPALRALAPRSVTTAELLALCAQTPRAAAPGERYLYSNTGYALLGAVIERVSGMSFGHYVAQHLCLPLALHDTAFEGEERSAKRLVAGHGRRRVDGSRTNVPLLHPSLRGAAGGLVSTADDLASFALSAHRLLPSDLWTLATQPQRLADGNAVPQSLLWQTRPLQGRTRVEHGGATPGFVGHLLMLPGDRLVAVALLNESSGRQPGPGFLAEQLAGLALGLRLEAPRVMKLTPEQFAPLLGRYGAGAEQQREIGMYEGQLMVRRGEWRALLEAVTPLHFIDRRRGVVHYHFERDVEQRITGLRIEREDRPPERLERQ